MGYPHSADAKTLKLSNAEVKAIRELYKMEYFTLSKLARLFDVHKSTISLIVNNKRRTKFAAY